MKPTVMFVNLRTSALAAICAAAIAPLATIAAEYVEGTTPEIVLMADSADGDTNTLEQAITAYNTANNTNFAISSFNGGDLATYAIVKEGGGTLVMDTAIKQYTGPIVIKAGVVKCMCTEALGADTTDSHVYVRDGATFYVRRVSESENIKNNNRNLHVVGTGHNGQAALNVDKARKGNIYNTQGIYGKTLTLDGDATVNHPAWAELPATVNLNGHTLIVKSGAIDTASNQTYADATFHARTLNGPGKFVIDDSIYYLQSNKFVGNADECEIEIRDNGGFRFWGGAYTGYTWPFRFTGEACWIWGDNVNGNMRFFANSNTNCYYASSINRVRNPVILAGPNGTTLKLRTQSGLVDNWVFMEGPISGNGDIDIHCDPNYSYPPARLSLLNPANSFTGTVTVDKGLLYVYEPGTLPSTVPLVVSRSHALNYKLQKPNAVPEYHGAEFLSPNPQTLGPLTFTSVADGGVYHSGRIQGGSGTFSKIDKQSPNTMEYYSGIGSPLLNVEGGVVKLPRGPAPGLWEGTNATVVGGIFSASGAATNLIARGPNILNNTLFAHFGAKPAVNTSYTGYIWNRTGDDATWTFAMSAQQFTRMDIDGVEVMRQRRKDPPDSEPNDDWQKFQTITLSPGPHLVHIRCNINKLFCTTNLNGVSNGTARWPENFGFVFDKQGRSVNPADFTGGDYSSITSNFEVVLDPGDGSLFTRSIDEADLPHFDEMRFAPGTTLDLNGNAYVAGTISGLPNVISSATDAMADPSLTITNRLVVNAAELANDPELKMTLNALAFGPGAGVTVTNLDVLSRGTYTLAVVTNSDEIVLGEGFRQNRVLDSRKWDVKLSANGKELQLLPAAGFRVSLR